MANIVENTVGTVFSIFPNLSVLIFAESTLRLSCPVFFSFREGIVRVCGKTYFYVKLTSLGPLVSFGPSTPCTGKQLAYQHTHTLDMARGRRKGEHSTHTAKQQLCCS
jgi:hypothetical protein